jgi:hypothetical protein
VSWPGSLPARLLLPALLLAATACGGEDPVDPQAGESPSTPASTPAPSRTPEPSVPPDAPECAELWNEGGPLPRGYRGCVDRSGTYVPRDGLSCSSGQVLVQYRDTYYAVVGGTIHRAPTALADDQDYRSAVRSCRA